MLIIKKTLVFILTYITLFSNVYGAYYAQNNYVVNIVNKNTKLCLVYNGVDSEARLTNCVNSDLKQQWIVPKSGNSYYVSRYDPNICLYIKSSGTVLTRYCSSYKTVMGNISYSYGGEAIWYVDNGNACLGISDDYKSMVNDESIRTKNKIKVYMHTCNTSKSDQHWKLNIISENYGATTTTKKTTTTTKKTTTTTKKTTTTTKKTTTTTKKTTTTTKKTTTTTKKTTTTTKKTTTTTKKTSTTTKTTTVVKTTTTKKTYYAATYTSSKFKYVSEKMEESDEALSNPYIGWYHGTHTIDLTDDPENDCNYIEKFNSIRKYDNGLQYLGIRLSEFRDKSISSNALAGLENLLNEYKKRKETVDPTTQIILRFYYDGNENCKTDKNNKPILKDSTAASDISEEGEFKQLDNGYSNVTMESFDYIKTNYDHDITDNLEFIETASNPDISDDETTVMVDNSDTADTTYNLDTTDENDNVIIINNDTDSDETKINARDSSSFNPAKEVIEKTFYTCIQYNSDGTCKKKSNVTKFCVTKVDYHKVNCVKYSTNEVEPSKVDIVVNHIKQLSTVVNKFKDLIFIYQGSFLGTWGEMHSSDLITLENLTKIMDTLVTYFDSSIYLGVRTPKYHRGILYEMNKNDKTKYQKLSKRLGLYNDGMFHDANDYGTYGKDDISSNNGYVKAKRAQELEYQNEKSLLAPSGGEGVYNEDDEEDKNTNLKSQSAVSNLIKNPVYYSNFYVSDNHARTIHLTYLNDEYHKDLMKKWSVTKGTYIYDDNWNVDGKTYISNHMGYRYVLRESSLQSDNTLNIVIENVGYAPAYVEFDIKLYIYTTTPEKQKISIYFDTENKKWALNKPINLSLDLNSIINKLTYDEYDVYFRIYDSRSGTDIKLGNKNNFISSYGYKLGKLTKK